MNIKLLSELGKILTRGTGVCKHHTPGLDLNMPHVVEIKFAASEDAFRCYTLMGEVLARYQENQSGRMSEGMISVRPYDGTYIARFRGKTASCTSGPEQAAAAVARKVMGTTPHIIEKCGRDLYWQVLSVIPTT